MSRDNEGQLIWQVKVNGRMWRRAYLHKTARRLADLARRLYPTATVAIHPY